MNAEIIYRLEQTFVPPDEKWQKAAEQLQLIYTTQLSFFTAMGIQLTKFPRAQFERIAAALEEPGTPEEKIERTEAALQAALNEVASHLKETRNLINAQSLTRQPPQT
jgi:hypothetical protein